MKKEIENAHEITINAVELASELAHKKLIDNWSESIKIFKDDESDVMTYTEDAQDLFNEYYDDYYTLIESTKI